jgi:N-acetylglutamate synthase-like GNAT family acetyltransferase
VPVLVRDAAEGDAQALCRLWEEFLYRPGVDHAAAAEEIARRAVGRVDEDPSSRIVVAERDGEVIGCALLRMVQVSPFYDDPVLQVSHLQVDPSQARKGAGRSLVEAALSWAEQVGVEGMLVASPLNDRDANRFMARMGLAQVAGMRGAAVTALRARLPHDPSAAARQVGRQGRNVGQVVAARRSQRRARARGLAI